MLGALAALPTLPALFGAPAANAQAATPLASWNDGPAKQTILDFVKVTTDRAHPNDVPLEDRIATFDQEGTLWVEHPLYVQAFFALDRVHEIATQHLRLENALSVQGGACQRAAGAGAFLRAGLGGASLARIPV